MTKKKTSNLRRRSKEIKRQSTLHADVSSSSSSSEIMQVQLAPTQLQLLHHPLGLGFGLIEESMHGPVMELQRILGHSFKDPRLLVEALTHPSHPSRPTYQRLEFVGDAALNLAFTNYLFYRHPTLDSGPLSVLRSANISTEKLARAAVRHGFYRFLRRNSPVQDTMVEEFTQSVMKEDATNAAEAAFGGTSVKAPKILADIVESIAAAVYVDAHYDVRTLWKVFEPLLQPIITAETLDEQPVTKVYELCQKLGKNMEIVDSIVRVRGDNMTHVATAIVDGVIVAASSSEHKAIAKLNVAREAITKLQKGNTLDKAPAIVELGPKADSGIHEVIGRTTSAAKLAAKSVIYDACPAAAQNARVGAKQELHQLCGKKHWEFPKYKIEREEGPAHDRRFAASVIVETPDVNYVMVSGFKETMKDAENQAAFGLLLKFLNV